MVEPCERTTCQSPAVPCSAAETVKNYGKGGWAMLQLSLTIGKCSAAILLDADIVNNPATLLYPTSSKT
jgi:hypothetical protein